MLSIGRSAWSLRFLTLIVTWPTILYVFRTDVFWLPVGESAHVLVSIWNDEHVMRFLRGQETDLFYTNSIFYPHGVSLLYQAFFVPYSIVFSALQVIMPLSNAFCVAYLLIIIVSILSSYVYMRYLIKDTWPAVFGALVFGLSPHIVGRPHHPVLAFAAPLPLVLYFFHRGIHEKRTNLIIVAGVLTGLTCATSLYAYVCLVLTLGLGICAFAWTKWRKPQFWINVALLALVTAMASAWRIVPMMESSQSLHSVMDWHGKEYRNDLISSFVNHKHPIIGPFLEQNGLTAGGTHRGKRSYLGWLPLVLMGIGLSCRGYRQRMLPWLLLVLVFFVLRMGSTLHINGTEYSNVLLPKNLLDRVLPFAFESFAETDLFTFGILTPFAVLSCFGLVALQTLQPATRQRGFVLLLIGILAFEYYVPVEERIIPHEQFAFLEWLEDEEDVDIRLINAPMGRQNAKRYQFYQALSGYPSVEGAISRPPSAAFEYIQASPILGAWREDRPALCAFNSSDEYLSALDDLVADGFTHVVYHREQRDARKIAGSFFGVAPAYNDEYANIYRIHDLQDHCPQNFIPKILSEAIAVETLLVPSVIHERHGTIIGFLGDLPADEMHLRYISQATFDNKDLVSISVGQNDEITAQSSNELFRELDAISTVNNAVWLVNNPLQTDLQQLDVYVNWFTQHYKFCRRYLERAGRTIDLYVRHEIPCDAAEVNSDVAVRYDNGIRLHNFGLDISSGQVTFYSAWTTELDQTFSFSIQIINARGERVLQYDNIVERQPVSVHWVDVYIVGRQVNILSSLIVYDFDTGHDRRRYGAEHQRAL